LTPQKRRVFPSLPIPRRGGVAKIKKKEGRPCTARISLCGDTKKKKKKKKEFARGGIVRIVLWSQEKKRRKKKPLG